MQPSQEDRAQEILYKQLNLLKRVHPSSRDLDKVLRKDMFSKSNKTAFQEVTYFLLSVLDPEMVKNSLTSWPIYEPKLEAKFRNEFVAIVHRLRAEGAPIDAILPSQLIAPGGLKFIKFMLKFASFVVYKQLEKKPDLLGPPRPHKNVEITKGINGKLASITDKVRTESETLFAGHLKAVEEFKSQAEHVKTELDESNKTMRDTVEIFDQVKEESDHLSLSVDEKRAKLTDVLTEMRTIEETMRKCNDFIGQIRGSVVGHQMDCEQLDLVNFFEMLIGVLEQFELNSRPVDVEELKGLSVIFEDIGAKYEGLVEKVASAKSQLEKKKNRIL